MGGVAHGTRTPDAARSRQIARFPWKYARALMPAAFSWKYAVRMTVAACSWRDAVGIEYKVWKEHFWFIW